MKALRIIGLFVIIYFITIIMTGVIELGQFVSRGNTYIEYAFYGTLGLLFFYYVIVPLIAYTHKPSMRTLQKMSTGDRRATLRLRKFIIKGLETEKKNELMAISKDDTHETALWIKSHVEDNVTEMDKIIRSYAMRLTATVMVSPNPFIDGISILFGNSKMVYELSRKMNLRYSWSDLFLMYFDTVTIASATGIIQEFDDELEEIFESIVTEFSEFLEEETGKSIGESIPFLNIFVKASVPIFQAASNYAYTYYMGSRYKLTLLNSLEEEPLEKSALRKKARRLARKARYSYIKDMFSKLGANRTQTFKRGFWKKRKKDAFRHEF